MSKILLIDDDDQVRYALKKYLNLAGHEIAEASNGTDGFRLAAQQHFDLVLTDIVMPDTDGIELIRQITSSKPELPIIAISGGGRIGQSEYLDVARQLGAVAVLPKPLDPDELLAVISQNAIR